MNDIGNKTGKSEGLRNIEQLSFSFSKQHGALQPKVLWGF